MTEDSEDYAGTDVFDSSEDKVGTVEAAYRGGDGAVRYLQLKTGGLFAKHHLVPVSDAQPGENGLVLPYSKDVVENSPTVSSRAEEIDTDTGARVRAYYEGARARLEQSAADVEASEEGEAPRQVGAVPVSDAGSAADEGDQASGDVGSPVYNTAAVRQEEAAAPGAAPGIGEIRDLGDVIEVPIVEEEIVKRPVVKEVLRISKRQLVETQDVQTTLRKEEAQVERTGEAAAPEDETNPQP